jgi:uncharacterized repeat protein (TIGR03809 family)
MTHRSDVARGREILARWCALTEQRLGYLTDLFETGRWRRYYSEAALLENIREAKAAVETWRDLSKREASRDNSAIDVSWLGRTRSVPLLSERLKAQLAEIKPEPPRCEVSISVEAKNVRSDDEFPVPGPDASVMASAPAL